MTLFKKLCFNDILNKTKEDNFFPQKYVTELYKEFNNNLPIISDSYLSSIKCFIPLPTEFVITDRHIENNKITKNDNIYEFHGNKGHRLLFSNQLLPFFNKKHIVLPLPFTFPIHNDNNIELVSSNIYYYEVTILDKKNLNDNWNEECISVGFGSADVPFESHVGWYSNSFGYHSDDGTFRFNQTANSILNKSKILYPGDTIGSGIIFLNDNNIKFFYTINGTLIYVYNDVYKINKPYFPIIGYDHPNSIKVNFSTEKFKFDIKNLINQYSDLVISTNNDYMNNIDKQNIPIIPESTDVSILNNILIKYNILNIYDGSSNIILSKLVDIKGNIIDSSSNKHPVDINAFYDAFESKYDYNNNKYNFFYDASGNKHSYDTSGNKLYYDASGIKHSYDTSGNKLYYDASGNKYSYDASGNKFYYNTAGNFIYC